MGVVDEAVEDGVGERGVADDLVPLLSDCDRAMARSLSPASNFRRKTSRIFRIDNLSVGMVTPLLKRGP